jgi:hypothetical protein
MSILTLSLVLAGSLLVSSACCFGQQPDDFPDPALTREKWALRVETARRQSEEFVANASMRSAIPPPSEAEEARSASQRALHDPSLQRGDIIATGQGFVVFIGRDEEHKPNDFRPAPDPR